MSEDPLERVRRLIDRDAAHVRSAVEEPRDAARARSSEGGPGEATTDDARLAASLTLDQLADAAGLSSYHFSRQFTARFGVSPIAYSRIQRLTAAAERLLRDRSISLIDLAFDCGFDSQEAFTRAFKRALGVPPGQYRRERQHPLTSEAIVTTNPRPAITLTQSASPMRHGALRIAGLSGVFDETTKSGIPGLWQQLIPQLPVPGQLSAMSYGVCMGISGRPGAMRYMAGVPVSADASIPEGFEVVDIQPCSYLVFRQVLDGGDVHAQMSAAAREIWGERLPRSGYRLSQSPDLEVYSADFMPNQAGVTVEWWIPVED